MFVYVTWIQKEIPKNWKAGSSHSELKAIQLESKARSFYIQKKNFLGATLTRKIF
jgi:hypothetical protein